MARREDTGHHPGRKVKAVSRVLANFAFGFATYFVLAKYDKSSYRK